MVFRLNIHVFLQENILWWMIGCEGNDIIHFQETNSCLLLRGLDIKAEE